MLLMASKTYSLAFCPPIEIVELVRQRKQLLMSRIGWYHSANSLAHITVASFTATNAELALVSQFAENFCAKRSSLLVHFDRYGTYANGAFFLAPDERSHGILVSIMKDFNRKMPLRAISSTDPHMSIARALDMLNLLYARMLFSKMPPDLSFRIDGLSLRRLDETRGQYNIVAHFPFVSSSGMHPHDCIWQGRLF